MTPTGSPQRQQAGAHLRRGARRPRPEPATESEQADQADLFGAPDESETEHDHRHGKPKAS